MLKYIKFSIVCLAFFATSCEDFFDTTIDIDPPKHEPKLALYGDAFIGQDTMELILTQSFGILDTLSSKPIIGAKITCTQNGQIVPYKEKNGISNTTLILKFNKPLGVNDVVDIKIEYPGFPILTATTTVPKTPNVSNVTFVEDGGKDEFGDNVSLATLEFKGNNGATDFFKVAQTVSIMFCIDPTPNGCNEYYTNIYSNPMDIKDPAAINGYLIKHDNAKSKNYRATTYRSFFGIDSITIDIVSMTESAFDYETSRRAYEESTDNPFSTPVNVRSNIVNGYGRFYIYNVTKFKF